nr:glutathione S-transferase N-terminal domain-containing protein [Comamonas jiangduensis]
MLAAHPQLRIPVLVTGEGHAISESLLIAQYLEHIGSGPPWCLLTTAPPCWRAPAWPTG